MVARLLEGVCGRGPHSVRLESSVGRDRADGRSRDRHRPGPLLADTPIADFVAQSSHTSVIVRTPDGERLADLLRARGAIVTIDAQGGLSLTGVTQEEVGEMAFVERVLLHELTTKVATLEEAFLEATAGSQDSRRAAWHERRAAIRGRAVAHAAIDMVVDRDRARHCRASRFAGAGVKGDATLTDYGDVVTGGGGGVFLVVDPVVNHRHLRDRPRVPLRHDSANPECTAEAVDADGAKVLVVAGYVLVDRRALPRYCDTPCR